MLIKNEKRTCHLQDFTCVLKRENKESEKIDKYLDFARKLKKLWNMRVTVVPIVGGALGSLEMRLAKIETILNTALLKPIRILRRVLETCGNILSLRLKDHWLKLM